MKIYFSESDYKAAAASYGFHSHSKGIREALARAGVLTSKKSGADVALWVGPPDLFRPTMGLPNVAFVAIEGDRLPAIEAVPLARANLVLVPCEHNRRILERHYKNVQTVPLGIDPARFPFVERQHPADNEPFRFLYVGNLHPSKGVPVIFEAFRQWVSSGKCPQNVEVYIKTATESTRNGRPFQGQAFFTVKNGQLVDAETRTIPGLVIDNRNLSSPELADVYAGAAAYVQPTWGEGWGLSLTEAMATGLPCIYTGWSAPLDYADKRTGFPMRYRLEPLPWKPSTKGARVDPRVLVREMHRVYYRYPRAIERGRRASELMHREFTWDMAASKLVKVLEEQGK